MKVQVHMRWWVKPYIFGCTTFAALTGSKPDVVKIVDRVHQHGLYYIDPYYREPYLANFCLIVATCLLGYSAIIGLKTNNPDGDTGAYIFGCMFMVLATMFKIYRSRR